MDRRRGIDTSTSVELIQVVLQDIKSIRGKMREVAAKSWEIQY